MYIYINDCDVHCDSTLYNYTIINCCRGEKVIVTVPNREDHLKTTDSDVEMEEDSDTEIIEEIRPRRRGPKRKKKTEIIPEISEKKVVRNSKRGKEVEETDEEITPEIWSEDEMSKKEQYKRKNPYLTKPKLFEHIKAWNEYGEEFSGEVIDLKPRFKTIFKLREHET